mmetsp:Transcript_1286/g.1978  ORF Transcript_1286/g.1978 Transcript_1286/m.1978 type:complete len:132 (-) Transcript_1286:617-1012(-)
MSSSQQKPPSSSSTSTGTGATNDRKRRREDHTAQSLRMDWQIHVSKVIQLASYSKGDISSDPAKTNIEKRAEEVVNNHKELKKLIGKMESVVRGKEEEVRGLILERGSSGCVGRRKKKSAGHTVAPTSVGL